jgi:hypothetical protein
MQKRTAANHFVIVIFLLLIMVQPFWPADIIQKIFAQSPSFVRQEIIDDSNDWIFWNGSVSRDNSQRVSTYDDKTVIVDKANNSSECEIDDRNGASSDIQSVSYFSDGKNLTAVMWLSSPFDESLLNDTIDIFRKQLQIKITHNNSYTLEALTGVKKARMPPPLPGEPFVEENFTMLSGNEARNMSYTDKGGKITQIWTIRGDNRYEIEYSAAASKYNEYLPVIQHMIDTFEIKPSSGETSVNKNDSRILDNFSTYESSEIKIDYPSDWNVNSTNDDGITNILFHPPFEDSWRRITFTMAIDIDSVHDAGIDYRIIYSRGSNNTWTKQVIETSAYDKTRLLEENDNSTDLFDTRDNSSVLFSFDLSKINSPQRYKIVFYITDYFLKNHRYCTFVDTTNWVPIPPPVFTISANPNSAELRPGEEKSIDLQLKSNTDLQSQAILTIANNSYGNDVQIDIVPNNKMSIPASGSGTYSLIIKALDAAKPRLYTLPINATISFPTSVTNRGGETFNNNKSVSIIETSNVTLTVLPPYSNQEILGNVAQTLAPLNTLTTFVVGVGTAVTPILLYMYRKRKKNGEKNA